MQLTGISGAGDPQVHLGPGFGGHHIAARTALDHPRIHGDPAAEISKLNHLDKLARKLGDGAASFFKIDSGMRRPSPHPDGNIAHALARGLEMSLRPLRRLEHQHGLAISGRGLHQRTPGRAACL